MTLVSERAHCALVANTAAPINPASGFKITRTGIAASIGSSGVFARNA